jgi:hypothetical protein
MYNEHYFEVVGKHYSYVDYGTLEDVMSGLEGNFEPGDEVTISLCGTKVVTSHVNGPDDVIVHDRTLHFELTHWETNASWWYEGVGDDDNYGEFVVLGVYDNEDDALDQIRWLAANCSGLIADDIGMFDASAITLDVRPCGCHVFDHSIDVYPDGTTSGLY